MKKTRKIAVDDVTKIPASRANKDSKETKQAFGKEYYAVEYFDPTGKRRIVTI